MAARRQQQLSIVRADTNHDAIWVIWVRRSIPVFKFFVPSVFCNVCFKMQIFVVNASKYLGTWWRHQMEPFSALLALCAGTSPVAGEFPTQRPVTRSLMFSLICAWINRWVNNREASDLRRHRPHYDVIVMKHHYISSLTPDKGHLDGLQKAEIVNTSKLVPSVIIKTH